MAGACRGSAARMRTCPRLVGWRLATDGVIALNLCSGSPNLSSDSGCTCHSMFADARDGSLRAKAPSCDGGIVSGPVLNRRYSSPIAALPSSEFTRTFRVTVFFTL